MLECFMEMWIIGAFVDNVKLDEDVYLYTRQSYCRVKKVLSNSRNK